MADNTHIEWADATVNAVNGCSLASPGCTNCYAMRLAATRLKHVPSRAGLARMTNGHPVWTGEVRLDERQLLQPLKWKRPRRIFWNAHGDLFHPLVHPLWIAQVLAVCALTPQHTHMILTKRAERMRTWFNEPTRAEAVMCAAAMIQGTEAAKKVVLQWPLPNVWLGVSVEDQARADERIPDLLATPAAVRWLSCEPLLGPVDLGQLLPDLPDNAWLTWLDYLDWIIVGGESGHGARPMHPDWARSLRDQCQAAGVPFLFKQWGEWAPEGDDHGIHPDGCYNRDGSPKFESIALDVDGSVRKAATSTTAFLRRCGKKTSGRTLDGALHDAYPQARP